MNNIKQEVEKITIPKDLHERAKLGVKQAKVEKKEGQKRSITKKGTVYKRLSITAAACLLAWSTFTFTPVVAAIQEMYDRIFSTQHIDDTGVRTAISNGNGQALDQTFYDEKNDITVNFEGVMTDDKETKLLLTFQSEQTDLENYFLDIFEGATKISLHDESGQKIPLPNVGWGSRYYDSNENKVAEALSFAPIKEFAGQNITLEIENITIYRDDEESGEFKVESIETVWPLSFTLDQSAISDRETLEVNKEFEFEGKTYTIKQVEFSALETRVVVAGEDTKIQTDETGMKYRIMSKLEHQFLNARKIDKEDGYIVDEKKSGVFLKSAGERVDPIFSKGEVEGADDEYIMIFSQVKDRDDVVLEVGKDIAVSLTK